jgi:hypothetical protein
MVRGAMPWRHRKTKHGRSPEAGTGKANETRQDKNNNRAAFIGLITAVITLGAAVAPLVQQVIHLRKQVNAQASSISSQRRKIITLQNQTVPNAPEGGSYLANMNPISDTYDYDPAGVLVVIGGTHYPDSLTFNCTGAWGTEGTNAPLIYAVSGTEFTAVIGFSDAAGYADPNVSATVTITDQTGRILGDRVMVSPGHPLRVQQRLTGVTRLGFTCTSADTLLGGSAAPSPPEISLANASV